MIRPEHVGRSAGSERHDHGDRMRRIIFARRPAPRRQDSGWPRQTAATSGFADHDRSSPANVAAPYARGQAAAKGQSVCCDAHGCALPRLLNRGSVIADAIPIPRNRRCPIAAPKMSTRRLAARHAAIIAAARQAASEGGMAAVQIAPVARRAGIAAGTVYRYFPGKTDLVAALLAEISEREIAALRRAADVAPGPLSALSAAIMTFAARALRDRRLTFAAIARAGRCRTRCRAARLSQSARRRICLAHRRGGRRQASAGTGCGARRPRLWSVFSSRG